MRLKQLDALNKPYKIYAEVLENQAIEQFVDVMSKDDIVRGALLPDAHAGYTLPIGGVVASQGMIYPSFVGYDIGCGMIAVRIPVDIEAIRCNRKAIFDAIYRWLPVGKRWHDRSRKWESSAKFDRTDFLRELFNSKGGLQQLGTLGSGNHFCEIGYDDNDSVWIIVHSGSRNLGHSVGTRYMGLAHPSGKAREGAYGFDADSSQGQDYIADMNYCLEFALENRRHIVYLAMRAINEIVPFDYASVQMQEETDSFINRNHNHAELKDGLWIHRKGATHAEDGMLGVIPGNMRDGSFIVRGKGNPESLFSSSHGAGRVLSRVKAKELLSLQDFIADMESHDVIALATAGTLDESPEAYKDIFEVMKLQEDLVDVLLHVRPLVNVKG